MASLLTPDERTRIAAAIATAEETTSGEIYCVVAHRASDYRFVPLIWGALAALLVPVALLALGAEPHRWPWIGEPWWTGDATDVDIASLVRRGMAVLVALQALVFILVTAFTSPQAIRFRVTPRPVKQELVHRAAVDQFLARGMQRTRERTGVLIFAALAEHQVEVIADEGIYGRVDPRIWDDSVAALVDAARAGRLADGFVEAIALCAGVLAEHFPPRQDDIDEIPNHIIEL